VDIVAGTRRNATTKYVLACDLGQSTDPTALCALEHTHSFREHERGGVDQHEDSFAVRHLQRLPLGMPYPDQIAEIARIAARPPLVGCEIVFDATGVGLPVANIADTVGMKPTRVIITAGAEQSFVNGAWHVAKASLVSILDARLHLGELRFAAELLEAGAMREELRDFKRKVSAAGRFQYEARVGRHDDLVLAVALALWLCVGRPVMPPPQFSFYSRSAPSSHLGTRAGNGRHVPSPGQPDSAAYDASPRSFWRMIDDIGEINK
jgi:hypothetical protein